MLASECCQGTADTADNDAAVALDLGQRSEVLIHQLACGGNSRLEPSRDSSFSGQLASQSPASPSEQRLYLMCWQCLGEDIDQMGQQRDVRFRQELLDLRCQLVDMGGSRRPWSFPNLAYDPVAFHRCDLNANRALGQAELSRDVLRGPTTGTEQSHDSSAARIKQLLPQHFGHTPSVGINCCAIYGRSVGFYRGLRE